MWVPQGRPPIYDFTPCAAAAGSWQAPAAACLPASAGPCWGRGPGPPGGPGQAPWAAGPLRRAFRGGRAELSLAAHGAVRCKLSGPQMGPNGCFVADSKTEKLLISNIQKTATEYTIQNLNSCVPYHSLLALHAQTTKSRTNLWQTRTSSGASSLNGDQTVQFCATRTIGQQRAPQASHGHRDDLSVSWFIEPSGRRPCLLPRVKRQFSYIFTCFTYFCHILGGRGWRLAAGGWRRPASSGAAGRLAVGRWRGPAAPSRHIYVFIYVHMFIYISYVFINFHILTYF